MLKRGVASLCVLAMVSVANADVLVDLVPVPAQPVGGYDPGAMIDVQVFAGQIAGTNAPADPLLVRTLQFDFTLTDPAIMLDSFSFGDFLPFGGALYSSQLALPVPGTSFSSATSNAAFMGSIPATGQVLVGTLMVTLPTDPGTYAIEAVSRSDDPNNDNRGGVVIYGFGTGPADPRIELRPGTGMVGDALFVQVIPEPATLAFLGLGGLALLRRRH